MLQCFKKPKKKREADMKTKQKRCLRVGLRGMLDALARGKRCFCHKHFWLLMVFNRGSDRGWTLGAGRKGRG